jgi:bacteriocin-like protein
MTPTTANNTRELTGALTEVELEHVAELQEDELNKVTGGMRKAGGEHVTYLQYVF